MELTHHISSFWINSKLKNAYTYWFFKDIIKQNYILLYFFY